MRARLPTRMRATLPTVSDERMQLSLMIALTFGTGIADAVGYLGLDRVFTGNMTGNVVILAMGLAGTIVGGNGLPVLGPLLALVGFMVGAATGGRVLRGAPGRWSGRTTVLLAVVGTVMLGLAVTLLVAEHPPGTGQVVVTTLLAAAMGLQAATARVISVKDVTTVVVTSTITGLAADSVFGSGKGGGTGRRTLAVLSIIAGAASGAALLRWHLGVGLLLAGAVVLVVTLVGGLHHRRGRRQAATSG